MADEVGQQVWPMNVGLLMCGHVHPDALDVGGDYPELLAPLSDRHGIELVRYDADLGQLSDDLDECAGWITSPARCSVNDATWSRRRGTPWARRPTGTWWSVGSRGSYAVPDPASPSQVAMARAVDSVS